MMDIGRRVHMMLLGLTAIILAFSVTGSGGLEDAGETSAADADSCLPVVERFERLKMNDDQIIYETKRYDPTLRVCTTSLAPSANPQTTTCCSRKAEQRLHQLTVDYTTDYVTSLGAQLLPLITANGAVFRDDYMQIIHTARNRTIRTLTDDYRIILDGVECCGFVDNLFDDIVAFLNATAADSHQTSPVQLDIRKSISRFFDELFSFVFRHFVTDSPTSSGLRRDRSFAACVAGARRSLRVDPIGETDDALADELGGSLEAARTLLGAFGLAAESLRWTERRPELLGHCSASLTRLQLCALCDGHPDETTVRPCEEFCLDVARRCFRSLAVELGSRWDLFVDAMAQLVVAVRGQFDVEEVVGSLPARMSEGIMNMMLNVPTYYFQVMNRCRSHGGAGVVPLLPTKSPVDEHLPAAAVSRLQPSSRQQQRGRSRADRRPSGGDPAVRLRHKIQMFTRQVVASGGLYSKLPETFCRSERLAAGNYDVCWNGSAIGTYNKSADVYNNNSLESQEVTLSAAESAEFAELLNKLDTMTKLLHSQRPPRQSSMLSDDSTSVVSAAEADGTAVDYDNGKDDDEASGDGSSGDGRPSGQTDDEDYGYDYGSGSESSGEGSGGEEATSAEAEKASTVSTTKHQTDFAFDDSTTTTQPTTTTITTLTTPTPVVVHTTRRHHHPHSPTPSSSRSSVTERSYASPPAAPSRSARTSQTCLLLLILSSASVSLM